MPLNYNKWDKLELSDDSDIEEHPNIDKRSMINWKRRDILEKRDARRARIAHYQAEIALNDVLHPRLVSLRESITSATNSTSTSSSSSSSSASPRAIFSQTVEKLKTSPSPDKPPTGHEKQPTYDEMILDLLIRIYASAKETLASKSDPDDQAWGEVLGKEIEKHEAELKERNAELRGLVEKEEKEQGSKITSDDIKEGFSSGHINKALPSPWEQEESEKKKKATKPVSKSSTVSTIEVLNPSASSSTNQTSASTSGPTPDPDDQEFEPVADIEDLDEPPSMTPSTTAFSRLPLRGYTQSWEFIQKDPSILMERNTDALLAEAFEAELKGEGERAKRCVHQGLMIQYCRKLGKDGVRLFFQRMQQGGPKAESVFQTDVNDTYNRMSTRCAQIKIEQAQSGGGERETIQLVAEDPSTKIGFNIPDGPAPENLVIEGLEEGQEVDIEEIKVFLNQKWEYFQGFPENLKRAMKSESLDEVNKVLERMNLEEAEEIVRKMQEGGMLSFSESGVRDMTGKE